MKLADWRMGTKLGMGFLVMVLFSAILGAVAWLQLAQMHRNALHLSDVALPSMFHAGAIEVPISMIQSVGDAVILSVPVDGLRQGEPAPAH